MTALLTWRRTVVLGVAVGLAALWLGGEAAPEAARDHGAPAAGLASVTRPHAVRAPSAEITSEGEHGESRSLAQVLARHRQIAQKAVPLRAERSELTRMLSSLEHIQAARDLLLAPAEDEFEHEDEELRLDAVSYLTDALRLRDNPAHAEVQRAVRAVILAGNHRTADDPRLRRSLAGDKVQLFVALARLEPDEARELSAQRDLENGALVAYAAGLAAEELSPP